MTFPLTLRRWTILLALWIGFLDTGIAPAQAADAPARVYVILWFDTEDYLLPTSDDAALRVAEFLSHEGIRATFKVVGEKARTLERRGRTDVIAALNKHEIGYHANYHSVQPTPAMYLSDLGWDEGVNEFDRREGPGRADIKRIFGVFPTCYGQPGSSWGPQVYGAMRRWEMPVYLDAGNHVNLDARPCYYCRVLTLYKLAYTLRADLKSRELKEAEDKFLSARAKLLAEGGGVVSIFYHPCEFVHREFWDGVNFRNGANPPRSRWKIPPAKTAEESQLAYDVFERYVRFIKRFPEVRFITASEAAQLYRDKARARKFTTADIKAIAAAVGENVGFQRRDDYALSAAEVFALLNEFVTARGNGKDPGALELKTSPYGPSNPVPPLAEPVTTDWSQFNRTAQDVADYLARQGRIPTSVWLGSVRVPPEAYLRTLAQVALPLCDGNPPPDILTVKPANLATAANVAADDPRLWGWVIFPRGFRAPAMMELAKRQAWTLKPALLDRTEPRSDKAVSP
jgi:hypothetical protein